MALSLWDRTVFFVKVHHFNNNGRIVTGGTESFIVFVTNKNVHVVLLTKTNSIMHHNSLYNIHVYLYVSLEELGNRT